MNEKALLNAEKIDKLLTQYVNDTNISALFTKFSSKFFTAPYSSNKEYFGAQTGGLAEYTIKATYHLCRLNETMKAEVPMSSLIKVGLLHEFGKIGYKDEDLFLPQESQWHRDRGMMYTINERLKGFGPRDRTMLIMNDHNIQFNENEYQAMINYEGQYSDANKLTRYRENKLTLLTQWAHIWAITHDKI